MKKVLLLLTAVVATLVVAGSAGAETKTVQITRQGFTPSSTTVNVGDSVTWRNADTVNHQVVANDGTFASPVLKAGETYTFTFAKSGKTPYHDSFATSKKGTITVNAPPASVSLTASTTRITYGDNTTVSGAVTNQLTNEPVTLTSQPYGKGTQSIATTTTQTNGQFAFGVSPTIQTSYQAHYRTANSPSVTVTVAPRVGFGRSGNTFIAKVTSDIGYSGKYVFVQKKNAVGGWYAFKRVYLGDTSRAVFKTALPKGNYTLRLVLPGSQAGLGYVQSVSRMIIYSKR